MSKRIFEVISTIQRLNKVATQKDLIYFFFLAVISGETQRNKWIIDSHNLKDECKMKAVCESRVKVYKAGM